MCPCHSYEQEPGHSGLYIKKSKIKVARIGGQYQSWVERSAMQNFTEGGGVNLHGLHGSHSET